MEEQNTKKDILDEEGVKIWIGEDKIVYVKYINLSEGTTFRSFEGIRRAKKYLPEGQKFFLDFEGLREEIKRANTSSSFRKRIAEQVENTLNRKEVEKVAIFSDDIFTRTVARFITTASGLKNTKVFSDKEKALKWLKKS